RDAVGFGKPVRVVEASDGIAGQYAGLWLSDLGIDVVKLEWRREADPVRFAVLNRGKSSVSVADNASRDLVKGLLASADVLLSDFDAHRRAETGLVADEVRAINPSIVLGMITPYGSNGPYVHLRSDSHVAAALAGHTGSQWAYRDGGVYPVVDYGS